MTPPMRKQATCAMAEECNDRTRCLHLVVGDGLSRRIDGPFRRFPFGADLLHLLPDIWRNLVFLAKFGGRHRQGLDSRESFGERLG